jgi:hypothetical protein
MRHYIGAPTFVDSYWLQKNYFHVNRSWQIGSLKLTQDLLCMTVFTTLLGRQIENFEASPGAMLTVPGQQDSSPLLAG